MSTARTELSYLCISQTKSRVKASQGESNMTVRSNGLIIILLSWLTKSTSDNNI